MLMLGEHMYAGEEIGDIYMKKQQSKQNQSFHIC